MIGQKINRIFNPYLLTGDYSLQTLVQSVMADTGVYSPGVESRDRFKCQGQNEMTNSREVSYNVHVMSVTKVTVILSTNVIKNITLFIHGTLY